MNIVEVYRNLSGQRLWTREELTRRLGSPYLANWYIYSLGKKDLLRRVRRDLYAVINTTYGVPYANRYQIGSKINDEAYIYGMSAFAYHGLANQESNQVLVGCSKRFNHFIFDWVEYVHVADACHTGIETIPGGDPIRAASIERAFADCLRECKSDTYFEQLLNCLESIRGFDEEKLLECLSRFGEKKVYQKAGYIFDVLKERFSVSDSFQSALQEHKPFSKTYFYKSNLELAFYPKWNLYAPKNPYKLLMKGGIDDGAIEWVKLGGNRR